MGFEGECFRITFTPINACPLMYRQIWRKAHRSIAEVNFYTRNKISIVNLTGFKFKNYLVTDGYVKRISHYDYVEIRFVGRDGMTPAATKVMSRDEFERNLVVGLNEQLPNIVLINLQFDVFNQIPDLDMCEECHTEIGEPVAVIGYQLNQDNLTIKQGIVSSFYQTDGARYLQVDATIRHGNAGSPVISLEKGKVIGLIGHKLTEVSQSYKRLKDIMNNNLQLLKGYQGRYNMDDIDPVQVLIANQNQIKYITKELYRITSMGVGYALPSSHIFNFFKENLIFESMDGSKNILAGF